MENNDITVSGSISGLIGGVACLILGVIEKSMRLTDRTFDDFAQVLILSQLCPGIFGFLVGTLAHLGVSLSGGAIFAHFLKATTKKNILIKGVIFGTNIWIILLGAGTFFKMPVFTKIPANAALFMYLGSAVYGFSMSFVLNKLMKATGWRQ